MLYRAAGNILSVVGAPPRDCGLSGGRGRSPVIAIRGYLRPEPEDDRPPVRWRDLFPGDFERPVVPRAGYRPPDDAPWLEARQQLKRISYWWTYSNAELARLAEAYL